MCRYREGGPPSFDMSKEGQEEEGPGGDKASCWHGVKAFLDVHMCGGQG